MSLIIKYPLNEFNLGSNMRSLHEQSREGLLRSMGLRAGYKAHCTLYTVLCVLASKNELSSFWTIIDQDE